MKHKMEMHRTYLQAPRKLWILWKRAARKKNMTIAHWIREACYEQLSEQQKRQAPRDYGRKAPKDFEKIEREREALMARKEARKRYIARRVCSIRLSEQAYQFLKFLGGGNWLENMLLSHELFEEWNEKHWKKVKNDKTGQPEGNETDSSSSQSVGRTETGGHAEFSDVP